LVTARSLSPMAHSFDGAVSVWSVSSRHAPADRAHQETRVTWLIVLLAIYVVLGLRRPGRMGSTNVAIMVASAVALGWAYIGLGR